MNKNMRYRLIILTLALLVASCVNDPAELYQYDVTNTIEARVSLTTSDFEPATEDARNAQTRTTTTDDDEPSTEIKNLWVIQLVNESDAGYKVVTAIYYSSYTSETNINVKETSSPTRIIYVANTFEPYIGVNIDDTEEDVQANTKLVASGPDCLTTDSDNNSYYILNGVEEHEGGITGESTLSCDLERNVAKISITVVNNCESYDFTINSVQLHLVPTQLNYCTYQLDGSSTYPSYDKASYTLDYPAQDCEDLGYEGTYSYVTYTPSNSRTPKDGATSNEDTKEKNDYANDLSTYMSIGATYTADDGNVHAMSYTIYLGADLTSDFSLWANKEYAYTITFDGVGDYTADDRISDMGVVEVDYTGRESSNCYILNPAGVERTYTIPVKKRLDEFWDSSNGYVTAADAEVYTEGADWTVDPMWYDGNDVIAEGMTFTPIDTDEDNILDAMEVKLPANCSRGSIVVAVIQGVNIVWSWHFWITDYYPYQTPVADGQYVSDDGTKNYSFDVGNGKVVKYAGGVWDDPAYDDVYAFDRSMGVQGTDFVDDYQFTALSYQFGRKDPFPSNNVTYCSSKYGGAASSDLNPVIMVAETHTLAYVVQNPTVLYSTQYGQTGSTYWCSEITDSSFMESVWFDKKIYSNSTITKSIFDPSPLGWQIPVKEVYDAISGTDNNDYWEKYSPDGTDVGATYTICGATFLCFGYRDVVSSNTGGFMDGGSAFRIHTSTPDMTVNYYRGNMMIGYSKNSTAPTVQTQQHAVTRNIYPITDMSVYSEQSLADDICVILVWKYQASQPSSLAPNSRWRG